VQVLVLGCGGESLVDGGHEYFGKWGGDGDAPVVLGVSDIAFAFV
jgi:hypothetical protein